MGMPPPFAPGPRLPLRGAGLGAPPGADIAICSDAGFNGYRRGWWLRDRTGPGGNRRLMGVGSLRDDKFDIGRFARSELIQLPGFST